MAKYLVGAGSTCQVDFPPPVGRRSGAIHVRPFSIIELSEEEAAWIAKADPRLFARLTLVAVTPHPPAPDTGRATERHAKRTRRRG